ncbi:hypothetical protein [Kribbella qitaiheensis]|uniref:hypothetical protein n=1 Tax=Kribbella qitaiheensis TaxID=1544730 RepID=UPI0019D68410|nr:hypothetical protein [Kribbella qitaiheensis]
MTNRALQRKHGVGYRTVAAALISVWPQPQPQPQPQKKLPERGSRLDEFTAVVDGWLRDDLTAPRKQRHTAKRIYDRLLDEHEAADARVSYQMVKSYVATRRNEIRVGAWRGVRSTAASARYGGRGRLR